MAAADSGRSAGEEGEERCRRRRRARGGGGTAVTEGARRTVTAEAESLKIERLNRPWPCRWRPGVDRHSLIEGEGCVCVHVEGGGGGGECRMRIAMAGKSSGDGEQAGGGGSELSKEWRWRRRVGEFTRRRISIYPPVPGARRGREVY